MEIFGAPDPKKLIELHVAGKPVDATWPLRLARQHARDYLKAHPEADRVELRQGGRLLDTVNR